MPDWVGIGCVKCGTSWTWRELRKHPQVFAPRAKEIMYFNGASTHTVDWYLEFFQDARPDHVIGEFTPDYFHHYEAPYRVQDEVPDAKLLVCFRHPVERAISNWRHAVHAKRLPAETTFADSFDYWKIRERGVYAKFLSRWYKLFPKDRIKVLWYDDIKARPEEYLREVYRFVGVDEDFLSPDYKDWFKFRYHKNGELEVEVTADERRRWLDYYLPHTEALEKMTGRDLNTWKV